MLKMDEGGLGKKVVDALVTVSRPRCIPKFG
jgi:hypothetical protein